MIERSSNDPDFFEAGFTDVCAIKKVINGVFKEYREYWIRNNCPEWNYEIIESEANFLENPYKRVYTIEIKCGIAKYSSFCIIKDSAVIGTGDIDIEVDGKVELWNKILNDIMQHGVEKVYQDHIIIMRNKKEDISGLDYMNYPLKPNDMKSKESKMNVETVNDTCNVVTPKDMEADLSLLDEVLEKFKSGLLDQEKGLDSYYIVIVGEYSRKVLDEVIRLYDEVGWKVEFCRTSSENNERSGLTGLKLKR